MPKYSYQLKRRGNPIATITVKAPSKSAGARKALRLLRPNIAAGFYDEVGQFHPIRASWDYSRSRAGEKGRRRAGRRRTKRGRRRMPY